MALKGCTRSRMKEIIKQIVLRKYHLSDSFTGMHTLCNQRDVQYLLLLSLLFLFVVCHCVKVVALPYMKHLKKELKSQCCVREERDQRGNDIEDKH